MRLVFCAAATWFAMLGLAAPAGEMERGSVLQGRVLGDGRPLSGAAVSDGRRIVRTDDAGGYRLPVGPDSGRFVFVTPPRGYWSERFHVPLETAVQQGSAEFDLRRVEQADRFDFAFLTDMHLERRDICRKKMAATLAEIAGLKPPVAFLLFQGDICLQSGSGDVYADCLAAVKTPIRHGAGNHEMMLNHANPRDDFEQRFGPTFYSFDWGPLHCIVLDGNKPIPGQTGWQAVHGAVEGGELEWLKADLALQPMGKPIVVGVHIPIVSSYPERRNTSPKDAPYWEMTNRAVLTDLFARHHVRLVLQGHMHENERTMIGGVEYVASISVAGSWWKAGEKLERGVDNCPRGYRIVSVDGAVVKHRYQSSAESRTPRRGEFSKLDKPLAADAAAKFVFNCYDAPNAATAAARIDEGPWQPMPAFAAPSPVTDGLTMPHHYRLLTDTTKLKPGRHTITARVTFPDKEVVEESGSFAIAPTPTGDDS